MGPGVLYKELWIVLGEGDASCHLETAIESQKVVPVAALASDGASVWGRVGSVGSLLFRLFVIGHSWCCHLDSQVVDSPVHSVLLRHSGLVSLRRWPMESALLLRRYCWHLWAHVHVLGERGRRYLLQV